ncbi:hypothetical protein FKX85_12250 [Echinicola soli]|uniref:Phage integrase SAM-like domain-containing protein n=1 Tax=Echinicola soli TaxID=2591634 RepID=A0A514CIV5_9BACT|nr:hypothetical protein [Echinicola soli]QDH79762.1 hypothetical protein FKX85_12250 [Echinicola soli]
MIFYLEEVRADVLGAYHEFSSKKRRFHIDELKNYFLTGGEEDFTLMKLVDYHKVAYANTLSNGSLKNYRTTEKYLKRYLKEWLRTADIFLSEIETEPCLSPK